MINAAVMGVIAPLRFVLLSDALLSSMNLKQIEAVFGHEAGHVHHRHIQHFLLFAVAGWLAVAGTMELAATALSSGSSPERIPLAVIEGVGLCATVIIWGLGFGWLSRRFERQADLFGAQCVTPPAAECTLPCSVHLDTETTLPSRGRVCATGAAIFASALDRVAVLNGIPHEERSWRHSSIGSRIRFLTSLAGDPNRLQRFERVIRRAKTALLVSAVVGLVVAGFYWMAVPEPAILRP
jgi:STE24 endopeptidase